MIPTQEVEARLRRMAELDILLGDLKSNRDEAVLRAETEYQQKAGPIAAESNRLLGELEDLYKKNRAEIEKAGKRSIECHFGRIGFRKGTGKLALLKGMKWPQVLELVKAHFSGDKVNLAHFVKSKETLNKEALKNRVKPEVLSEFGVKISAPERFFAETFPDKLKDAAA